MAKVTRLVETDHGGDWKKGFDAYAKSDGQVSKDELWQLLKDAGVGNFVSRGTYVARIFEVVDRDGDDRITWDEFAFLFRRI